MNDEYLLAVLVPYREHIGDYGFRWYTPLNPTGRWKLETGPYYTNHLFIEHKGRVFKSWVSESAIEFRPAEKTYVGHCGLAK